MLGAAAFTVTTSLMALADDGAVKPDEPLAANPAGTPFNATTPSVAAPASTTTVTSADDAAATATPQSDRYARLAGVETVPRSRSVRPNRTLLMTGAEASRAATPVDITRVRALTAVKELHHTERAVPRRRRRSARARDDRGCERVSR